VVSPVPDESTGSAEDQLGHAPLANDAVRHSLGAVSALLPVGLFATDALGQCWYLNQRLIDYLDLELTGPERPLTLMLPLGGAPAGLTGHQATVLVRYPSGPSSGLTTSGRGEVAGERTLEALVIPQVRGDGTVGGYLGVITEGEDATSPAILHASSSLVDTLLDNSPDVISVFNADASWRYSNAAAWRLLGYQADFDPANGAFELLHPDDVHLAVTALGRVLELPNGESLSFEARIRAFDGSWHYMENLAINLLGEPTLHGVLVRSQDITERREARIRVLEANQRLSTLIASLHIAAVVEDEHRAIVLTNQAFVDLFEVPLSPDQLAGRSLHQLGPQLSMRFGDPTRDPGPDRVAGILRERRRVVGDRIAMPDGRVIERDYLPIHVDREYRGHLWLFRDVSTQAHAEAEWEQLLSQQRSENERLVDLDHIKSAFLAEISHELRTPLTSILSFTELLQDGVGSDDPVEQEEFLGVIARNADRLLRLVDDLLLLDRMERGAHPIEWGMLDLPSLIATSVTTFTPQAEAKSITIESEVGEGPPLAGDAQRMAQLLDVLLSNAVKFTPQRGKILVSAAPIGDAWQLEVADSGIGIPPGEHLALFERFYRAPNARAARIPGSGLGLSVARAVAELHGGKISIQNGRLGGAVATVVLPISLLRLDEEEALGRSGRYDEAARADDAEARVDDEAARVDDEAEPSGLVAPDGGHEAADGG
jgi:PAS domain S-box-containing protein